jgi:4-aminobutyrate aminotransferase/(S)-3-amino-2-methylpropionate transaminase
VTIGAAIHARMLGWQLSWPQVGDVRGLGAMLAIELVSDAREKTPAPELASAVVDEALRRGLILLKAGIYGNCIRVLCPLTISDTELDEGLAAWEDALAAALS